MLISSNYKGGGVVTNFVRVAADKFTCEFNESGKTENVVPVEPEPIRALKFTTNKSSKFYLYNYKHELTEMELPNVQWSYDGTNFTDISGLTDGGYSEEIEFGTTEHPILYIRGNNPYGFNHVSRLDGFTSNKTMMCIVSNDADASVSVEGKLDWLIDYTVDSAVIQTIEGIAPNFDSLLRCDKAKSGDMSCLTDASNLELMQSDTFGVYTYNCFLRDCTNLVNVPDITEDNVVLTSEAYSQFFNGCPKVNSWRVLLTPEHAQQVQIFNISAASTGTLYVYTGTSQYFTNKKPAGWDVVEIDV